MWKESEEIKFAKHQCCNMFRIPIFCIDFFFWYTKGSHTASDVILSPLFWQSVETVGQTPSSSSQSSSVTWCTLHLQDHHQPIWKNSMKSKSGLFPRDLLFDHSCLFLPKRETTQDFSALQDIPLVPFDVLRFD